MRELSREEQVLLHLMQRALNPRSMPLLSDELASQINWQTVMQESANQAVLVSALDAAAPYKSFIPDETWQQWFRHSSRIQMNNLRVMNAQRELVMLLEGSGFPYVILKGEAAAARYPKPELRHLGDVDFLIDPKQKERVEELLTGAGYTGEMHDHICHVVLKKPGAHLEMHFEIAGIPYGRPGELVREYMSDALSCAKRESWGQGDYYAPCGAHQGMILLLHMQHHMVYEGLGLRHLIDWAAYVQSTWQEAFWTERLIPALKKIGLMHYASVMTCVCVDAFGISRPDWASADSVLCHAVLLDILTGGNFGRKDKARSKAGMMISEHGKDGISHGSAYNLWRILHDSTAGKYPVVQKYPILHPVFDVYRAGLYLARTVQGKRPSLTKLAPLAQERRTVYEQLRIFESEETGE